MAFAAPIAAFAATQKTPNRFSTIFRFGITPLFLFSGTFFPIDTLPAALQVLAWFTPLFHGVALTRALSLGVARRGARRHAHPRHLLSVLAIVGGWLTFRTHRSPAGARMTALRVAPAWVFGSRRSLRLIERNLYVYKHGWMILLSGFFEPLFYLLGDRLRARGADRDDPGPGRPADPLPAVRRAGAAGDARR